MLKSLKNRKILPLVTLIIAGETIFFLPFILPRIFRPTLLLVFDITNTELGAYFSVYGVVAMISYFFGGPLADRFSARFLMSLALWLTAFGGFSMSVIPMQSFLAVLYGFWGMTTILLFWAALIRATREWGGEGFQGRAFGWLEGGRGATAAILGTITLIVFSSFNNEAANLSLMTASRISTFKTVILITSSITAAVGVLVWLFVPDHKEFRPSERIKAHQLLDVAKLPSVWLIALIIICAYVGYKITDDYSLYANEVLGYDEFYSAAIGTGTLWIRAIVAVFAGYFADKLKASSIISICFAIALPASAVIAFNLTGNFVLMAILNLAMILIGAYGVRALYFALIQEAKIPILYTGTAVGLISVLGFTPDVFMSPWMGYLLDKNPGPVGHQHVFLVLFCFSIAGFTVSLLYRKINRE